MGYKDSNKQREYQRLWINKRRATWFEGKICTTCGSTDRLELDHIDPSTKVTHAIWSWREVRRSEELAKCQILCYDCHKKKTKDSYGPQKHGTSSMYQKNNCRCQKCKEYNRDRVRRWRAES